MEKNDLICDRSFGDKFNELSSFILDNFKTMMKWSCLSVLPCAILLTAVVMFVFEDDGFSNFSLITGLILGCVMVVFITELTKPCLTKGVKLKEVNVAEILPGALVSVGRGLVASIVPLLLVALVAVFMDETMFDSEFTSSRWLEKISLLFIFFIIVALFLIPVYFIINVVVHERLSFMKALRRGLRLSVYRPIVTLFFMLIISVIGFAIPLGITSVLEFFYDSPSLFVPVESFDSTIVDKVFQFISAVISAYCFIGQFVIIGIAMTFEYGNAVERVDNVTFMNQYDNFENL